MKQALLLLSMLIILSLAVIQLSVFPAFQEEVLQPVAQFELEYLTSGSIDLLADELSQLPKEERDNYLQNVRTDFGFILLIQPLSKNKLLPDDKKKLLAGEALGDTLTSSVYKAIDNKEVLVFKDVHTRPSHLISKAQRWLMGAFFLLQKELNEYSENDWSKIIKTASTRFKYPISIVDLSDYSYEKQYHEAIMDGSIVTIPTDYSEFIGYPADYAIQRIGGSNKAILIGPVAEGIRAEISFFIIFYYLLFGIFLLVPIIIWLLPAWRSMSALKEATVLFGRGRFEARAKLIRFSQLNHLSQTYNNMAGKIQRLISSHKNLTNAVSHELRTPIARIEFNVELLRNCSNHDYQLKQLDHIESSLNELNLLVSEMLTHARFDRETPELTFEAVELSHWLEQEIQPWQNNNPEMEITLSKNISCVATIERFYMSRAVSNLIRNAIAYGQVNICISHHKTPTGWQLWVEDDGNGVELADRQKVFTPFFRQDDSRNLQIGGTGLGLSIVQQIMDWHGGKASVDSSCLGGARFILSWSENRDNSK
jgi:two-component system, OmpR family, sensor histidine kinase RstB